MPFPLAALAIMAGAKAVGGLMKKQGQKKAAKEQYKKDEQNLQAKFESDQALESNREDDRLQRMQFIGSQLKGARALDPAVLQAALTRRKSAVRKGVAVDQSKGMGWGMVGDVASGIGDIAGAYAKGVGMGSGAPAGGDSLSRAAQVVDGSDNACPPAARATGAC